MQAFVDIKLIFKDFFHIFTFVNTNTDNHNGSHLVLYRLHKMNSGQPAWKALLKPMKPKGVVAQCREEKLAHCLSICGKYTASDSMRRSRNTTHWFRTCTYILLYVHRATPSVCRDLYSGQAASILNPSKLKCYQAQFLTTFYVSTFSPAT